MTKKPNHSDLPTAVAPPCAFTIVATRRNRLGADRIVVRVPVEGGMEELLDPQSESAAVRKIVAAYARKHKLGARWIREKNEELGIGSTEAKRSSVG